MINTVKFAAAVRTKRGDRTLREASRDSGIPHQTLQKMEKGENPDLTTFTRICKWLGVPMDFFASDEEPKAENQAA